MNLVKNKYCFTAYHRGGLEDCLLTENAITVDLCFKLIRASIYEFYAYDERIKADRYILKDYRNCLGFPSWIHVYQALPNHYIDGDKIVWRS